MPVARLLIAGEDDANMRYAAGLCLHDPFIWIRFGDGKKGKEYVIVSKLEFARVKQEARIGTKVLLLDKIDMRNLRHVTGRSFNLADYAAAFLLSYNISEVLIAENCWGVHLETLREHMLRPKILAPFFPERLIKTSAEIAAIKHAGLVTKKAFRVAYDMIRKSTIDWNDTLIYEGKKLTSEMVRQQMELVFIQNGCSAKDTIVACADHSSQPHNCGSGPLFAGVPIVIDIFPRDNSTGYYFDMTRTVIKGTPSQELRAMYQAVKHAQIAGINAVRAGRRAAEVHAACASIFERLKYETSDEEGFIHSTGHGLGLGLHELPRIRAGSNDVLAAGMVVTIEPGLYYKGLGGVRIEDTVLVTATGCANLTNVPKLLILK